MFVLIDLINLKAYISESKPEISKASGFKKKRLDYYSGSQFKGFYINKKCIFAKVEVMKSKQGGGHGFQKKRDW